MFVGVNEKTLPEFFGLLAAKHCYSLIMIFCVFIYCLLAMPGSRALADETQNPITFNRLKEVLQQGATTLDQFLSFLPPAAFEQYSLVYQTRSTVQFASAEVPRIIFAPKDSDVLFSVGGDLGKKGGEQLELIHINKKNSRFDFYLADFKRSKPRFVADSTCFHCHQGKPIWDSYPIWPGVYGSVREDHYHRTHPEKIIYDRFLNLSKNNFRYSLLLQHSLRELDETNLNLNKMISKFSADFFAKQLLEIPEIHPYLTFFAAETVQGKFPRIQQFVKRLPPSEQGVALVKMNELKMNFLQKVNNHLNNKRLRLLENAGFFEFDTSDFNEVVILEYILGQSDKTQAKGLDIQNLSSSFEKQTYATSDGALGVGIAVGRSLGQALANPSLHCKEVLGALKK